ncbi:hypothetical protein [Mesorhizobium marinum]
MGLFVSLSVIALVALVDEHCDPNSCEYAIAVAGGLVVPSETKSKWPMKAGKSSLSTGLERAVLTQAWADDLDVETTYLQWKSLKPASERALRMMARSH